MAETKAKRVAIVGARGVGKFHAHWWALAGAEVCAFSGVSAPSMAKTLLMIQELAPFKGRSYTNVEEMISEERPDIVDVCSPMHSHFQYVRTALEHGCDVLCEKPFLYEAGAGRKAIMSQAALLAALAEEKGLSLSVSTQYSAGARFLEDIWNETRGDSELTYFKGHLQAPQSSREATAESAWMDLSPHPISVLLHFAKGGTLDRDSLDVLFEDFGARAKFRMTFPGRPPLDCDLVTRFSIEEPVHVRYFQFNDLPINIESEPDAEGVYGARIDTHTKSYRRHDFLRVAIRNFLEGRPCVSMEDTMGNLDLSLRVLERSQEQATA